MRRYAFLQCFRCRHFRPKSLLPQPALAGPAFATPVYIGICAAAEPGEWIVWQSLEWAANHMGLCPDRPPPPAVKPECPLYDLSVASSIKPYPDACIYHGTPACPKC